MVKKDIKKKYIMLLCSIVAFLLLVRSFFAILSNREVLKISETVYTEEFRAEEDSQQESVSIELHYPQISGLGDSAKEERINTLIRQDIFEILEHEPLTWSDYCFSAGTMRSEVKFLNDNIISIFYTGYCG